MAQYQLKSPIGDSRASLYLFYHTRILDIVLYSTGYAVCLNDMLTLAQVFKLQNQSKSTLKIRYINAFTEYQGTAKQL